jgi:hypothetical protein
MSTFDFATIPDYSDEDDIPDGIWKTLHFVSRFLVTFRPERCDGLIDFVTLAYFAHSQRHVLDQEYSISDNLKEGETLYGFWAGFNQKGEFVIFSPDSGSLNIGFNKELEKKFLSNQRVIEKLKLLMPDIKVLGSVSFKCY